jgi:hypothetical protein
MNYINYLHVYELIEDRANGASIPPKMEPKEFDAIRTKGINYVAIGGYVFYDATKKTSMNKNEYSNIVSSIRGIKNVTNLIIVYKFRTINSIKKIILNEQFKIEFFTQDELYINPIRNEVAPKYIKITKEDLSGDFLPEDFKIIYDSDKAIRWLGYAAGDIIKVIYKGDTKFNLVSREIDYFTIKKDTS